MDPRPPLSRWLGDAAVHRFFLFGVKVRRFLYIPSSETLRNIFLLHLAPDRVEFVLIWVFPFCPRGFDLLGDQMHPS